MRERSYWWYLPHWLARECSKNESRPNISPRVFHAIMRGQYDVFRAVRILDDLFDQQTKDGRLAAVSNRFFDGAERAFGGCFTTRSQFWKVYRESLATTLEGILEVDRLQRKSNPAYASFYPCYRKVNAILKLGSAALCLRAGRIDMFREVEPFMNNLGAVGQVIDDIEDIVQDLDCGKTNAAAAFLLGCMNGTPASRLPTIERIAQAIMMRDGFDLLLQDLMKRTDTAFEVLHGIGGDEAGRMRVQYMQGLARIQASWSEKKINIQAAHDRAFARDFAFTMKRLKRRTVEGVEQ